MECVAISDSTTGDTFYDRQPVRRGKMTVARRHRNRLVTRGFLYFLDRCAGHRQPRAERVSVRVPDDFVLCFQFRSDALRAQEALAKRLSKFSLTLKPKKTKLVEFGRYAYRHASKQGRKRPETIYFLGFTLYCIATGRGTFELECLRKSHDCGARSYAYRIRCGTCHCEIRESSQSDAPWPLCILRRCRESSGTAASSQGCGILLAQNVEQ